MNLVIFDIDGTLTRTTDVDARYALKAFAEEFGIPRIDTDWSRYENPSDLGITREVLARHFGRAARPEEIARLEHRFLALLRAAVQEDRAAFVEVPGARRALDALAADDRWAVAIASGGWRSTSLCKLGAARIDIASLPAVFSDKEPRREEILRRAVRLAEARRGTGAFGKVVSVGDAVWDVRAARNAGLAFLGVGDGRGEDALRRAGAAAVISDYQDLDAFLHALERARVPGPESC
jgi:phosphoglycolate phosphatase-like HAD superfamily hydrolase